MSKIAAFKTVEVVAEFDTAEGCLPVVEGIRNANGYDFMENSRLQLNKRALVLKVMVMCFSDTCKLCARL